MACLFCEAGHARGSEANHKSAFQSIATRSDPGWKRSYKSECQEKYLPVGQYGSYAPWPILLAHHQEDFSGWLKRFYSSGEPNIHFSDMPEILPGWNLRLNVQADGKGYLLLLADTSDKTGFA